MRSKSNHRPEKAASELCHGEQRTAHPQGEIAAMALQSPNMLSWRKTIDCPAAPSQPAPRPWRKNGEARDGSLEGVVQNRWLPPPRN